MNKIFIEAKNNKTSEYHFLRTILAQSFPDKAVEFIYMDGIGNLFSEAILNQMKIAQVSGEQVLVFADADTVAKSAGFIKRKTEMEEKMATNNVMFPYFLYPNHQDDGDVEVLMEKAVRRDLHPVFFDCFEDYEKCVSGMVDEVTGLPRYNVPNLKAKLHTYMSAQPLNNKQRKSLGTGNWLFADENY